MAAPPLSAPHAAAEVPLDKVIGALERRPEDDEADDYPEWWLRSVEVSQDGRYITRLWDQRIFPAFVGEDYVANYVDQPSDTELGTQVQRAREAWTCRFREDEAKRRVREAAERTKRQAAKAAEDALVKQEREKQRRSQQRLQKKRCRSSSSTSDTEERHARHAGFQPVSQCGHHKGFQQMKDLLRDDVIELLRARSIWPMIVEHPNIDHDSMLAPKGMTTCGELSRHIEGTVLRAKEGWRKYKFGVTTDPVVRWEQVGDYKTTFQKMHLLLCTASKKESDSLETYLIRVFQMEDSRCKNERPGGEGPKREDPPHFTYVVTSARK